MGSSATLGVPPPAGYRATYEQGMAVVRAALGEAALAAAWAEGGAMTREEAVSYALQERSKPASPASSAAPAASPAPGR